MWKKAVLISAASLVVVLIASALLFGPKDEALIQEALDSSIRASRSGQPGGVAEYMSRNITFNDGGGSDSPIDQGTVARVVRFLKPDVEVVHRDVEIRGSTATMVSPVNITLTTGQDSVTHNVKNVTITYARETGLRWGIIPYPKWRIRDIHAEGFDPGIFMGGLP